MNISNKTYQKVAFIFDRTSEGIVESGKDVGYFGKVVSKLNVQGKDIIEIGCGTGDNLIFCSKKGAKNAIGMDLSQKNIALAEKNAGLLLGENLKFFNLPFEKFQSQKKFDLVIVWGVIEYFENPFPTLKKIQKLVNPGGHLLIYNSQPIFLKKISNLFRFFFNLIPQTWMLPFVEVLTKCFSLFVPLLSRVLYLGESNTYSLKQTILEGLMVPRYNLIPYKAIMKSLSPFGFSWKKLNSPTPSMYCILGTKIHQKKSDRAKI